MIGYVPKSDIIRKKTNV